MNDSPAPTGGADPLALELRSLGARFAEVTQLSQGFHARAMSRLDGGRGRRRDVMRVAALVAALLAFSTAAVAAPELIRQLGLRPGGRGLILVPVPAPSASPGGRSVAPASPRAGGPSRPEASPAQPSRQGPGRSAAAPPPGAPGSGCDLARLVVRTSTDKADYHPQDTVGFTITVTNPSAGTCYAPAAADTCQASVFGYGPSRQGWDSRPAVCPPVSTGALQPLAGGTTISYSRSWNQQECVPQAVGSCVPGRGSAGDYVGWGYVIVSDGSSDTGAMGPGVRFTLDAS
ncbi:MAG TPA: hypothetical protein VG245_11665 [Candidatus Dormibacteraeota bacterium]|jgi:hypothetical protein|nr:hypothetical protein [Candidatus Dormibacteraeota bacterium]